MGQLFAAPAGPDPRQATPPRTTPADPPNIYIRLSSTPATDIDYTWLTNLAPGTRLEAIRDPLLHIIGPMAGMEFVGQTAGWNIWHNRGKFYGEWIHSIRFQSIRWCNMDKQQRILPRLHERSRNPDLVRRYLSRRWSEVSTKPIILMVNFQ